MRISVFLFPILITSFLLVGCRPRVDGVMDDSLLRRGGEYWELFYLNDRQTGFQRTALTDEEVDGKPVKRFERQSRLVVLRYGNRVDMAMKIESRSGADGAFTSSETELAAGGETIRTRCRIENGRLIVEDGTDADWTAGTAGPEAVIRSLLAGPMKVEERRRVEFFEPAMQRRVAATLLGQRIESVEFEGKPRKLLRIESRNLVDGAKSEEIETLWTDAAGNILQRECRMGDGRTLLAVRTNRDRAAAVMNEPASAELGDLGVVPLNRAISKPESARKLVFLVQMDGEKPSSRFPVTTFQNLETSADGKTARLTIWSAVGDEVVTNPALDGKRSETTPADLASGRLIDTTDPKLLELVGKIDDGLSPWQQATACEELVNMTIRQADFSTAFASSSEVLRTGIGDCTEYAVLLAALCRAKKIPCRVVLGLVYTPLAPSDSKDAAEAGMAFHLWNEVFVDGLWRPLDATQARGGADAARITIASDSLSTDSPAPLTGSVLDLLGRLKINVAE